MLGFFPRGVVVSGVAVVASVVAFVPRRGFLRGVSGVFWFGASDSLSFGVSAAGFLLGDGLGAGTSFVCGLLDSNKIWFFLLPLANAWTWSLHRC